VQRVRNRALRPPTKIFEKFSKRVAITKPLDSSTIRLYHIAVDTPSRKDDQIVFLTYGKGSSRPTAHRLLREEVVLVRAFILSGNLGVSAREAGLSEDQAKGIMARPEVKQYADEQMLNQAAAAGVTRESVLYAIADLLRDPTKEASQAHLKAIDTAAKVLKMVQPAAAVTIQQGSSPFANLTDEQFHEEMVKRLSFQQEKKSDAEGTRLS
jgi:hypothetical protein